MGLLVVVAVVKLVCLLFVVDVGVDVVDSIDVGMLVVVVVVELVGVWMIVANDAVVVVGCG